MKSNHSKMRFMVGMIACVLLGMVLALSGCSGVPSFSAGGNTSTAAAPATPTPQQVAAYAAPWLQAAASVANSLQAAGVIDQAKNLTASEAVANAALLAVTATPTQANSQALQAAMVPVYQQVNTITIPAPPSSPPSTAPPTPVPAGGK